MVGFIQIKVAIILLNVLTIGGLTKVLTLLNPILKLEENNSVRKEIRDWFILIELVIGLGCILIFLMI